MALQLLKSELNMHTHALLCDTWVGVAFRYKLLAQSVSLGALL